MFSRGVNLNSKKELSLISLDLRECKSMIVVLYWELMLGGEMVR